MDTIKTDNEVIQSGQPKLYAALSKAQGMLSNVTKNKRAKAGSFSYSYANISDVLELIRPVAAKNGLAIVQTSEPEAIGNFLLMRMVCWVTHESGEFLTTTSYANPGDWSPKSVGSCETYLRRYQLIKIFSIAAEDDDGTAAQQSKRISKTPVRSTQTRPVARHTKSKSTGGKEINGLWSHIKNAAKADGMVIDYGGGKLEGDWRKLLKTHGFDAPKDWRQVDCELLRQVLKARETKKQEVAASEDLPF